MKKLWTLNLTNETGQIYELPFVGDGDMDNRVYVSELREVVVKARDRLKCGIIKHIKAGNYLDVGIQIKIIEYHNGINGMGGVHKTRDSRKIAKSLAQKIDVPFEDCKGDK